MQVAFYDEKFYLEVNINGDKNTNKFRLMNFQERDINIMCIFFYFQRTISYAINSIK